MGRLVPGADLRRVRARPLLAVLVGVLSVVALVGAASTASAGRTCLSGARDGGYSYAGHQSAHRGHGVRATITLTRKPTVDAGHVAGWVGVGGPRQGADGRDAWIQAGIAAMPGLGTVLYAEVTRPGRSPQFILVDEEVSVGHAHHVAVLESGARPGSWRVWVDGKAVSQPVQLRGSSGRWAPIATAESWNAGTAACNGFGFRFERVSVSYGGGGSWRPFVSGHRFLDGAHTLRDLAAAPAEPGVYASAATRAATLPYAFVASS